MNILIPHSWLLEHLETPATPEQIKEYLSLSGPSVERIVQSEGEPVYDIEVTTNRVDAMSVRGIAREAAVILSQFGLKSRLKPLNLKTDLKKQATHTLALPAIKNDPHLNKRVLCVVLSNVNTSPTPDWMAKRLRQVEMNIHDSMIDITNYVTHELGYPCHAFDYDKLMKLGGEIIATEAKKDEKFITLDNEEYSTLGGEVVLKNQAGVIIDLPSIKGTANSAVDHHTKNILFFMESVLAEKVRYASMSHAIRTVAAQLLEKNVDPHQADNVLARGIELYGELCQAQVASPIYDDFPGEVTPTPISLSLDRVRAYLGIKLSLDKIKAILQDLQCQVLVETTDQKHKLVVTPPTFRPDLNIPADIIEEIARIYGYHNLPSVIMDTAIPLQKPARVNFALEDKVKHFLATLGWQELYTYSMVSAELADQAGYKLSEHLKLQNPLTEDKEYLRRSLIPSLAEIIDQNQHLKQLSVFEMANIYHPQGDDLPKEELHLTLVSNKPYREIMGDVESLLDNLFVSNYQVINQKTGQQAQIVTTHQSAKVTLGFITVIKNQRVAIDLDFSQLLKVSSTHPKYQPIAKTYPVIEDLTFTLPAGVELGEVIETIKSSHELVDSVILKDVFRQNHTFTLTYLDPKANLSSESIGPIRQQIVEQIETMFKAQLVGQV